MEAISFGEHDKLARKIRERGGLSLAGAQAGELTDAREASAGVEASSAQVSAASHGRPHHALADAGRAAGLHHRRVDRGMT